MTEVRKEIEFSTVEDPKWRSNEVKRTMLSMWGFDPDKPISFSDDFVRGVRTMVQEVADRPRRGRTVKSSLGLRHQYKRK